MGTKAKDQQRLVLNSRPTTATLSQIVVIVTPFPSYSTFVEWVFLGSRRLCFEQELTFIKRHLNRFKLGGNTKEEIQGKSKVYLEHGCRLLKGEFTGIIFIMSSNMQES